MSRDTVELRDGTVLLGDVISMSMTAVVVPVEGKELSYPRNQVKKLMLVERVIQQNPPLFSLGARVRSDSGHLKVGGLIDSICRSFQTTACLRANDGLVGSARAELRDWPQVSQKSFFGFTALYRDKTMFGLLPRTRCIFKGNAVAFRFQDANLSKRVPMEQDSRGSAFDKDKTRWFTFELSRNADLHDALDYLGAAYDAARGAKKTRSELK